MTESMGALSDFNLKTPVEVAMFLKDNGNGSDVCEAFEENEVDGEAFMDLSELDVKTLTSKLGVVKKILRLKVLATGDTTDKTSAGDIDNLLATPSASPTCSQPRRLSLLSGTTDLSPTSPFLLNRSSRSPFSPPPGPSASAYESDDTMSVESSASAANIRKFALPRYWPPSIQNCIDLPTDEERSRAVGPLIRNEVVRALATQMFCYSPKPSKEFCTEVAKMLVKKYSFLLDKGEKVSGYIIEKVHNLRSTCKLKRPLSEADADSSPKAKRGRPKVSQVLTRYPLLRDVGGDDITVQRNITLLTKELEKERPRKEILLSLARQTYGARRQQILAELEDTTATVLLQEFPVLKKIYVIEQEIDMILERQNVMKTAQTIWTTKIVPAILEYGDSCSKGKAATAVREARTEFDGDECKEEKVALAILCKILPKKTLENTSVFVYEECQLTDDPVDIANREPKRAAPRFACFPGDESSQYFICIESEILCVTHSFSQALMLWFIAHYIFNLEYCIKVK